MGFISERIRVVLSWLSERGGQLRRDFKKALQALRCPSSGLAFKLEQLVYDVIRG